MTAAEFFEPNGVNHRLEELSQEAYHERKKLHTLRVGVVGGHRYWVFDSSPNHTRILISRIPIPWMRPRSISERTIRRASR